MMGRSQAISRIIGLCLCLAVILTACGVGHSDQEDVAQYISPSPTPAIALEERVNHQLGTAENPFIMLIKPLDMIDRQIPVMLTSLGFETVTHETNLREGDTLRDDLADLQVAIETTFGVRLLTYELEQVQTTSDLNLFIKNRVKSEVTRTIFDRTSLYVDIEFVDYYGQAVNQLCRVDDGLVRMAWLDGLSYLAASEQTCGDGEIMLLRGDDRDLFTGIQFDFSVLDAPTPTPNPNPDENVIDVQIESPFVPPARQSQNLTASDSAVLILDSRLGATNPNVLETRTFCQLEDQNDFYSVFLSKIVLDQENVIPAQLREISDVESLLQAVALGDCAGAMVSSTDYQRYSDAEWFNDLRVSRTISPFPYGILAYPLEVEIGVRQSLNTHLIALANDLEEGWYLRLLLGFDGISEFDPEIAQGLREFVTNLGYDFSQLGD